MSKVKWLSCLACLLLLVNGCGKKNEAAQAGEAVNESGNQAGEQTAGQGVGEYGEGDGGTYTLTNGDLETIFFAYNEATLDYRAKEILRTNFDRINKSNKTVVIEGHCDERGTDEYNIALGERRALTIKNYLVNLGVSAKRLRILSYGEERPAVSGSGEDIWSKNRRGEFRVGE